MFIHAELKLQPFPNFEYSVLCAYLNSGSLEEKFTCFNVKKTHSFSHPISSTRHHISAISDVRCVYRVQRIIKKTTTPQPWSFLSAAIWQKKKIYLQWYYQTTEQFQSWGCLLNCFFLCSTMGLQLIFNCTTLSWVMTSTLTLSL